MSRPAPIIFWTLTTRWPDYRIIGVTTEKNRQVYGRDESGDATHRRKSDCYGRFPDRASAVAAVDAVRRVRENYARLREPWQRQLSALDKEERRSLDEVRRQHGALPL